jgi:hypothetical protein
MHASGYSVNAERSTCGAVYACYANKVSTLQIKILRTASMSYNGAISATVASHYCTAAAAAPWLAFASFLQQQLTISDTVNYKASTDL